MIRLEPAELVEEIAIDDEQLREVYEQRQADLIYAIEEACSITLFWMQSVRIYDMYNYLKTERYSILYRFQHILALHNAMWMSLYKKQFVYFLLTT